MHPVTAPTVPAWTSIEGSPAPFRHHDIGRRNRGRRSNPTSLVRYQRNLQPPRRRPFTSARAR